MQNMGGNAEMLSRIATTDFSCRGGEAREAGLPRRQPDDLGP